MFHGKDSVKKTVLRLGHCYDIYHIPLTGNTNIYWQLAEEKMSDEFYDIIQQGYVKLRKKKVTAVSSRFANTL